MNNYNYIKNLGDEFIKMVRRGMMSIYMMDYVVIYEFYSRIRKENGTSESVLQTAVNYNCGERKVYKIIKYMETEH